MYNSYGPWSALGSILGAYIGKNMFGNNTQASTNANANSILLPQQKTIQQSTGQQLVPNTFVANTTVQPVSGANLGNQYSSGILDALNNYNKPNFF